jgi:SAM-dependent methyltransferase
MANKLGSFARRLQARGMDMSNTDAKTTWEQRYGERDRIWSGRVNVRLAEVVATREAGRALDLGCGEGADACWLAERGWTVVAVDISDTALQRAAEDADTRGLGDRIEFVQHDLSDSFPDGTFDLVSAQFLHSTVRLDRTRILKCAAAAVRPNGLLLIVDHAGPPPWASKMAHHHEFPSTEEVVSSLDINESEWQRVHVDAVERQAEGPDGETGTLVDNVITLRRGKPVRG